MTANPEQSAMEKVRQRWPDAEVYEYEFGQIRCYRVEDMTIHAPDECLSVLCNTEAEAWLDAASRLDAEHE